MKPGEFAKYSKRNIASGLGKYLSGKRLMGGGVLRGGKPKARMTLPDRLVFGKNGIRGDRVYRRAYNLFLSKQTRLVK